jgi:oxygen-independent coproporphyrinogen-3 oxidase
MSTAMNDVPFVHVSEKARALMHEAYSKLDDDYWRGKDAATFRFDNFRQMVDRKSPPSKEIEPRAIAESIAAEIRRAGRAAVYAGLPWCIQTCSFCDLSYGQNPSAAEQRDYASVLHREMALYAQLGLGEVPINSCYFGGGTPSMLETDALSRYIDGICSNLKISPQSVVTCEASAATLSVRKLDALRERVNRISLGVQTTDTRQRQVEGRILPREKLLQKVSMAMEKFDAVNVDLMYGLRGDSKESIYQSLCDIIDLGVPSITFYRTELFPGTKAFELARVSPWDALLEKNVREFYFLGRVLLEEAGYSEHPLGWFIKARVNRPSTWQGMVQNWSQVVPYVGVGLGAFSTSEKYWMQNTESLLRWKDRVLKGELPVGRFAPLDSREQFMVRFMRHIRVHRVMDMNLLADESGIERQSLTRFTDGLVSGGLVVLEGDRLTLTVAGESLVHIVIDEFVKLAQNLGGSSDALAGHASLDAAAIAIAPQLDRAAIVSGH